MHCAVFCFRDTHGQFSYLSVYQFLGLCFGDLVNLNTRLHTLLPLFCLFLFFVYAEHSRLNSSITRQAFVTALASALDRTAVKATYSSIAESSSTMISAD